MFISKAWADSTAADAATATGEAMATGGGWEQFIPFILIALVFYFLLIRPQQKKMKDDEAMRGGLQKGDKVLTAGGIVGKVLRVDDGDEVTIEIAENVKIKVYKAAVNAVLSEKPKDDAAQKEKK